MADTYESLRIPPHSIEAEQSVLGGVLINSDAWIEVARLKETDFYREDHRLLFRAMRALANDSQPIDIITLPEFLTKHQKLEDAGGFAYMARMAKNTPSAANIKAYVQIVREKALLRSLIAVGTQISDLAYQVVSTAEDSGKDAAKAAIAQAAQLVFELETESVGAEREFVQLKIALRSQLDKMQTLAESKDENPLKGYSTGFPSLDRRFSGLEKGRLYIVAARPGMGKTTFGLNIIEQVAKLYPELVLPIFSMEMDEDEIAEKFISSAGSARFDHVRNPARCTLSSDVDNLWAHTAHAIKQLGNSQIYLDCSSVQTPAGIRSRLRRLVHQTGGELGPIMVDYIQLMAGDKGNYPNREAEISEISRQLKRIAKDFGVPVLALSQLNRSLENRQNKRPILSDLRESGSIEQDANAVLFLYRDDVYNPDCSEPNKAEVIAAKGRAARIGTDYLVWQGEYQRFKEYSPDMPQAYEREQGGGSWH